MADVDDLLGEELEGLNDPNVEYLPEAPTLTGRGQSEEMYGEYAETPIGRPSSPPLFAQAALFEQVQQLRVWRVINGVPSGLGTVAASATEEDLIRTFYDAMPTPGEMRATFRMRPLDTNGREVGQEITVHIDPNHAALQAVRRAQEGPSNGGSTSAAEVALLQRTMTLHEARTRQAEAALEAERERIRMQDHQLAQERVDLARSAAEGVAAMSERMLEADSQRHQQAIESERARNEASLGYTVRIFDSQLQQSNAAREREGERLRMEMQKEQQRFVAELERERMRAEAERERERDRMRAESEERRERIERERREWEQRREQDRREYEQRMAREREEHVRRMELRDKEAAALRDAESERARASESERQRSHELRMKQIDLRAAQDREHAERMMQLAAQREETRRSGGLEGALVAGAALLQKLGVDPKEFVGNIMGTIGGGGTDWGELLGTVAQQVGGVAEKAMETRKAEIEAVGAAQAAQAAAAATSAAPPPGYALVPQALLSESPDLPQPGAQPQAAHAPVVAQGAPAESAPAGPRTSLNLKAQKAARGAIRALVETLSTTPQGEWSGTIAAAISAEPGIFHYVNDVTVRYALAEGGARPEHAENIVAALQASTLVPALNYG